MADDRLPRNARARQRPRNRRPRGGRRVGHDACSASSASKSSASSAPSALRTASVEVTADNWRDLLAKRDASDVYCPDAAADAAMREFINDQKAAKDTAGGIVEAHVFGCPIGLGSCMTWDGRLDSRIAAAVVGIQAFKGVEIGLGFETARRPGSQSSRRDRLSTRPSANTPALGFIRGSNNAGGLEGGMTNGMPVVVRGAMKPISTLGKPLQSVDLNTKETVRSRLGTLRHLRDQCRLGGDGKRDRVRNRPSLSGKVRRRFHDGIDLQLPELSVDRPQPAPRVVRFDRIVRTRLTAAFRKWSGRRRQRLQIPAGGARNCRIGRTRDRQRSGRSSCASVNSPRRVEPPGG